jgi:hypothetical protein
MFSSFDEFLGELRQGKRKNIRQVILWREVAVQSLLYLWRFLLARQDLQRCFGSIFGR